MMITSGRRATHVPAMTALACAVAGILLLASSPSMAQSSYQDPGQIGKTDSWKTEEFSKNWGLQAIGAEHAYARGLSGAGINVGVMDSGVARWHTDLQGSVQGVTGHDKGCTSPNIIAGSDACYYSDGSEVITYTPPMTQERREALEREAETNPQAREKLDEALSQEGYKYVFHGTHVAGIIAAHRNGSGTHGVAFASALHAAAIHANTYDSDATLFASPEVMKSMYGEMVERGVRVINNSWGLNEYPSTAAEMDALAKREPNLVSDYSEFAKKNDIVQVWAAGNVDGNIAGFYPSVPRYDKTVEPYWLSVVNFGTQGRLDESSAICGLSMEWCIAAPGTDIQSTLPGGALDGKILTYEDQTVSGFEITKAERKSDYEKLTGASMAAPHVTGGLALLMERFPYLTSAQVRDVLLTTAKDLGDPGVDEIYGWGLMDLKKAIDGPGQMRVDTEVKMDRRAGGAKVWQGAAWDDWRNDIGGTGKLSKSGAGWLRLSGNNTFGGAVVKQGVLELNGTNTLTSSVQVLGGELLLNGSLQRTALDVRAGIATVQGKVVQGVTTVAADARLQGTGSVSQTSVAGTIAPGVAGIGTLQVDGRYTQLPGSVYEVDLGTQGKADLIDVRGQADLQGGKISATGATLGERYRILTAQSIDGKFASANTVNQPFLSLKLDQTANRVEIDVKRGKALTTAAFTANQWATANAADGMSDDGVMLKHLTQLDAAQATAAFDRISAETHASQRAVFLEQGYGISETAASRLRSAQDGFSQQGDDSSRNGVWVDARSQGGHLDGNGNAARATYQIHGMRVGYDRAFGNGWMVGVLGASDSGDMKVAERSAKNESRSRTLGVYAGKEWNALALRAGWSMTDHRVTADRQVAYGTHLDRNQARYTSKGQQGFVEAGYTWKLSDRFMLEPYAQWSRVEVKDPGFKETGGASALIVAAGRSQTDFATAGVRFATRLAQAGGQDWLQLSGALAYRVASGDWQTATTAGWQNSPQFTSWGAPLSERATLLNLNVGARLSNNTTLDLGYDGQYGSESRDHTVNARVTIKF